MVKFNVYFDGQLVENPIEWEDLAVSIQYDHTNQITSIEYATELTFIKNGFEFLYARRNDDCELIPVLITMDCGNGFEPIVYGNIFITDCVFDELHCEVQTFIQDDGFSSRIQNNKNTGVSLGTVTTKNGLSITPAAERLVLMFDPSNGFYEFFVRGYTVFEAFKFIVSWMSDNTVDFVSDYFETGDGRYDWLCSGVDLRNRALANEIERENPPSMSFEDLFTMMRRLTNIAIGFQRQPNGRPILRIEPLSFFRNSSVILDLTDVNKTELSFIEELLFARITIGSEIIRPNECDNGNAVCSAGNNVSYYGFDEEEYAITGECNKDIELNLSVVNGFVIDTSTIEDVLFYDNDNFDKDTFLIHTFENTPSAYRAVQTDVFGIGKWWYNERFTNKEVLLRYIDYLVGDLLLFSLYNGLNLFLYEGNVPSGILLPTQTPSYQYQQVALNNLIYDPFNRVNTGNERFTPVDEGVYQFCVGVNIDDFPSSPGGILVQYALCIELYDSTDTLLTRYESDTRSHFTTLVDPKFEEWVSPFVPMDSGDYCIFTVRYSQGNNPAVLPGQAELVIGGGQIQPDYFQCCASRVVIQDIQANTGQERRISKTAFDYNIPWNDFKQYLNDTTKLIRLRNQRIDREGWNNEITYKFATGECNLQVLSTDR